MQRLLHLSEERKLPPSLTHAVLLPIPTARDGIHVTGSDKLLPEIAESVGEGSLVCGYGIPRRERERMISLGARVFDGAECESFLRENSYISALGAMGYILTEFKRVPRDLFFGVVGYGRIGSALVEMLLFFGARVRVYTRRSEVRESLGRFGIESAESDLSDGVGIGGLDVLINTAPADMRAFFPSGKIPVGVEVIELASGDNFGGIEGVVRLMSIPDKIYPRSAAAAYCNAIENYIKEVF